MARKAKTPSKVKMLTQVKPLTQVAAPQIPANIFSAVINDGGYFYGTLYWTQNAAGEATSITYAPRLVEVKNYGFTLLSVRNQ